MGSLGVVVTRRCGGIVLEREVTMEGALLRVIVTCIVIHKSSIRRVTRSCGRTSRATMGATMGETIGGLTICRFVSCKMTNTRICAMIPTEDGLAKHTISVSDHRT